MLDLFPLEGNQFDGPVLVTGAGGCIGSWALALLDHAGIPAVAMDLVIDRRRPALLLDEAALGRVAWHAGDIADTEAVARVVKDSGARAILHLAALQVPFCKADPVAGARVNVVGTVNIFEAARAAGIRRVAYASSIAAHGAFDDAPWAATLYGAYKYCNEQTARVYWSDWGIPSVGLRPGVVYGVGRDQGMTSRTTVALLAAAAGEAFTVPFRGPVSWLHAGEVAHAFLRALSVERAGAPVFDINGVASTVEDSLALIRDLVPGAQLQAEGAALPFPMDLDDTPLRSFLGGYAEVPLADGMRATLTAFRDLLARGQVRLD